MFSWSLCASKERQPEAKWQEADSAKTKIKQKVEGTSGVSLSFPPQPVISCTVKQCGQNRLWLLGIS